VTLLCLSIFLQFREKKSRFAGIYILEAHEENQYLSPQTTGLDLDQKTPDHSGKVTRTAPQHAEIRANAHTPADVSAMS